MCAAKLSDIKVTLEDPGVGTGEMSKLHPSKPISQPDGKSKTDLQ
jgi:hypothetical protein